MRHFATALLAFGIMVAAVPPARAAETTCPPNPAAGSTVDGNLVVPSGATCTLAGVTVTGNLRVQTNAEVVLQAALTQVSTIEGNVHVGTGGSLLAANSTIDGNIDADQCFTVSIETVTVDGNVHIQNCTGGGSVAYIESQIDGNFACNNNPDGCVADGGNVKGNVQIKDNGVADVRDNSIGGNLQCQGNTTIVASGNTVGGNEQGQCKGS
jgi:hypothetical protein